MRATPRYCGVVRCMAEKESTANFKAEEEERIIKRVKLTLFPMFRYDNQHIFDSYLLKIRHTTITSVPVVAASSSSATETPVVIGTHDGNFHCDEALAISLLKNLKKYENAVVIRTRK